MNDVLTGHIVRMFESPSFKFSVVSPSSWAEEKRIMGKEETNFPGYYSYDRTPYLREIVDMLKPDHPATEIAIIKASQLGMSTGIIENGIGYLIDENPCRILLAARDEVMVKKMMRQKIDPMIDSCGLRNKLVGNTRKKGSKRTGDTDMSKEFVGGNLDAYSIQKPEKMVQVSAQVGFLDDFERAPVAKDAGSADSLFRTRFTSFGDNRKIVWCSTPEVKHTSNIEPLFFEGDQRKWFMPCPCCGDYIVLEWNTKQPNGRSAGIKYDLDEDDVLIESSVHYRCQICGEDFHEGHKQDMLAAGEWRPTVRQKDPTFFSYVINALNAPVGMADWGYYVKQFLKACPPGKPIVISKYKTFIQTVLARTWEEKGKVLRVTRLARNTRHYPVKSVPDQLCYDEKNGEIVLLTMAVDINGDKEDDVRLDYEIVAWSENGCSYSVDHGSVGTFIPRENTKKKKVDRTPFTLIKGAPNNVWDPLTEIVLSEYTSNTLANAKYNIGCFVLDSRKHTAYAYDYIEHLRNDIGMNGAFAVMGMDEEQFKKRDTNMAVFKPSLKRPSDLMMLNVHQIKDELSVIMDIIWDEEKELVQPAGFMNFPAPTADKYTMKSYFSHYEGEVRRPKTDSDGKETAYMWEKKNSAVQNHFWDCRIYNMAAKEIVTHMICKEEKITPPNWRAFCNYILGK